MKKYMQVMIALFFAGVLLAIMAGAAWFVMGNVK
jgi:uncharacterized membrane protein affecting hemolysin expression